MPKLRRKLLMRSKTPMWVLSLEALLTALAVHAVLFFLVDYQPERQEVPSPESPGVSLLTPQDLASPEWVEFTRWMAVHDPALIARADHPYGYAALMRGGHVREVEKMPGGFPEKVPLFRGVPEFQKLAVPVMPSGNLQRYDSVFAHSTPRPVPRLTEVRVFDGKGRELSLTKLTVPEGMFSDRPSVISGRDAGGLLRQSVVESCGVAELDRAALQALATEPEFFSSGAVTIYWPEPESKGDL